MKSFLFPLALLLASATAAAADGPIAIDHAYSHPTAAPGVPGVGFFTLTNQGRTADRLLSAQSPAVGRIEIHQSSVRNGVMQMRAVTDGVALPAGQTVAFAPGGLHLMLFSLAEPLREGAQVPVTLTFERAGTVSTMLTVEPRDDAPAADDAHAHHQHAH
jgi:copper(I)-binding protein